MRTLFITATALALCAISAEAQTQPSDSNAIGGEISWSALRTDLQKAAAGYAAKLIPKVPDEVLVGGAGWSLLALPALDVKTGGGDVLDAASLKVQGFVWPSLGSSLATIHLFPFALGVETASDLDEIAAVAEVGWAPIGPARDNTDRFGLTEGRRLGVFLQGGYLFDNRSNSTAAAANGPTVASQESPDSAIARLKAEASYSWTLSARLIVRAAGRGWYDIKNDAWYYSAEGAARVVVVPSRYFVDFKYQSGSGAPSFNRGDQYGVGLSVAF